MTLATQRVLRAMLEDPTQSHYGFDLSRRTGLLAGTLYSILARLETAGWASSAWEEVDESGAGRPRRRYYRLTGEGQRIASEAIQQTIAALRFGLE